MHTLSSISIEHMLNITFTKSDEELVSRYLADGHKESFELLCNRYTVPMYRFAMSFVKNKDEAEDIVQKTFIKMWKHIHTFDVSKKFSVWLYTIARRTALDELKKRKTFSFSSMSYEEDLPFDETLADPSAFTEKMLESTREVNAFEQVLATLSPEKSEIVFLKLYEDMTFEEISLLVDRPMNTVKSIYRRALEVVKKELEEKYHINAPKDRILS